jgi:phosphohistidine swiveling domain-containing protein
MAAIVVEEPGFTQFSAAVPTATAMPTVAPVPATAVMLRLGRSSEGEG